jgi:hypothetical protein
VEIHLGALGLLPPEPAPAPEPDAHALARAAFEAQEQALRTAPLPAAAPSTASWPISEAPASLNIKLKIGNMELMYVRPVQTELAQVS